MFGLLFSLTVLVGTQAPSFVYSTVIIGFFDSKQQEDSYLVKNGD